MNTVEGGGTASTPVAELWVTGDLCGRWARWLRSAATGAPIGQPRTLIVDLSGCTRIDAADIELLLELHRTLRRDGGRLVIREPAAPVRRLLQIARIDRVLAITPAGDGTDRRSPVRHHGEAPR
ncbi:MAG TPA: STAS domain-containing protein [Actinoplanes sp.]|nr:STAS domain-containing protein [Actinoplanes sp.]